MIQHCFMFFHPFEKLTSWKLACMDGNGLYFFSFIYLSISKRVDSYKASCKWNICRKDMSKLKLSNLFHKICKFLFLHSNSSFIIYLLTIFLWLDKRVYYLKIRMFWIEGLGSLKWSILNWILRFWINLKTFEE